MKAAKDDASISRAVLEILKLDAKKSRVEITSKSSEGGTEKVVARLLRNGADDPRDSLNQTPPHAGSPSPQLEPTPSTAQQGATRPPITPSHVAAGTEAGDSLPATPSASSVTLYPSVDHSTTLSESEAAVAPPEEGRPLLYFVHEHSAPEAVMTITFANSKEATIQSLRRKIGEAFDVDHNKGILVIRTTAKPINTDKNLRDLPSGSKIIFKGAKAK